MQMPSRTMSSERGLLLRCRLGKTSSIVTVTEKAPVMPWQTPVPVPAVGAGAVDLTSPEQVAGLGDQRRRGRAYLQHAAAQAMI